MPPAWNVKIPINLRTGIFALLMATLISLPISLLMPREAPLELPGWCARVYYFTGFSSFGLLPLWSISALGDCRPLARIGIITSVVLWTGLIVGALLFPAVSA